MTAPRTEAGRALLAVEHEPKGVCWTAPDCDCAYAIVLIEAEAVAAERARIRAAMEALPTDGAPTVIANGIRVSGPSVYLRDVLALLELKP